MRKLLKFQKVLHLVVAIALMSIFFGFANVSAQPTQALIEDWRNVDYSFASKMMASDLNGNIYVVGDTAVGDYLIIKKFSAAGALLWQTAYNPSERLRGVWIAVDQDNNPVVLASIITGSYAQPAGWVTLKYDTNGGLLWANSLPGPFSDARRVAIDANNNIYVAGRMWLTNSSGNTTHDSVLIKYNPNGARLWAASFDNGNGTAVDEPFSLAISPDGSRIGVAGTSGYMFMALMYDSNGNRLWANVNNNAYGANDLVFGPGNVSYFATGTYFFQDPNSYQMAIAKLDATGKQVWLKSYNVGDRTYRIRVDGQGNVVATGIDVAGNMDWMTIKTDSNGNLLWSQRYDGGRNNDEYPLMLEVDSSDAVYVTGRGGPNPGTGTVSYLKGVVAKYSSDGTPQWAVWDDYAGGRAIVLGADNTLTTLGYNYLVVAKYTQTGLTDLIPAAPTNLTGLVFYSYSSVTLNFTDNASNEFWVEAERCTGSGCTNFSKVAQSLGENTTGLSDTTISRGVTYTYRVRARGFMGLSGPSNTVEVVVPPLSPPEAPSNLTAAMSDANVVLNWQDNSTNESQFLIERCQGAGCTNFTWLDSRYPDITTLTDYTTAAGVSYSYRVRAWNLDGYSSYSNVATIITSGGSSLPAAPGNLIGQALNKSQIKLSWANNSVNQDSVKIERCRGSNCTNFTQVATASGTANTYTDSGLAGNTTYRHRVRAHNSAGDSPYSNIASTKTLRR